MRSFRPENALQWARELSFPRLVGTSAEVEARRLIARRLAENGVESRETSFDFYPALSFGILKNLLVVGAVLLLAHRVALALWPQVAAVAGLVIPLIARRLWATYRRAASEKLEDRSAAYRWHAALAPRAAMRLRSGNVIADLPCKGEVRQRLVLSAHTDSKSQNMAISTRIAASIVFALGAFGLPVLAAPAAVWPAWIAGAATFWWVAYGIVLAAAALLGTLKVTDVSPGATDDAGSCGVLMEVARTLRENPPEGVAVRVVFTGAEELGLAGAYHYARSIAGDAAWRDALHLNYEAAGGGTKLWLATGTGPDKAKSEGIDRAVALADAAAGRVGVKAKRLGRVVGGEADHIPLVEAGLAAVTLMFSGPHSTKVHTAHDGPDLLSEPATDLAGRITLAAVEILEERGKTAVNQPSK